MCVCVCVVHMQVVLVNTNALTNHTTWLQAPLRAGGLLPFSDFTTAHGRAYLRRWRQTAAVVVPSLAVLVLTLSHELRAGRLPTLVSAPPVRMLLRAWTATCTAALDVPLVATVLGVAEVELLCSLLASALRALEALAAWPVLRVLGIVLPLLSQLLEVRPPFKAPASPLLSHSFFNLTMASRLLTLTQVVKWMLWDPIAATPLGNWLTTGMSSLLSLVLTLPLLVLTYVWSRAAAALALVMQLLGECVGLEPEESAATAMAPPAEAAQASV